MKPGKAENKFSLKYLTATLVAGSLLLSVPALAQFKDLMPGHPAYSIVKKLVQEGVLEVPKSQKFEGRVYINKYQLAVVMDRLYTVLHPDRQGTAPAALEYYNDVPAYSYASASVGKLTRLKVFVPDSSLKFSGNQKLSRYSFYYLFSRFLEAASGKDLAPAPPELGYSDVPPTDPYFSYIQKLIGARLLPGGQFKLLRGDQPVNRLEMALFVSQVLDYLRPEGKKQEEAKSAFAQPIKGYLDVAETNPAREAIDALVEVGILDPGYSQNFNGDQQINKYQLMDFAARMLEKLTLGEGGELELADASLEYKDVNNSNPYYRSIQKLIALGGLPAGNQTEIFGGDRPVNRYQLALFLLTPLEKMLSDQVELKAADPAVMYRDVAPDNFAYPAISKLIWLGALPGGADQDFEGSAPSTRYDLAIFSVKVLGQLYNKIREEDISLTPPPDYGFRVYSNTELSASSAARLDLFGRQTVNLTVDRSLTKRLSAYLYLQNDFYFGSQTPQYLRIGEVFLLASEPPLTYQIGRAYNFTGYSPFGASLFMDSTLDQVSLSFSSPLLNLHTMVGKLLYNGEVATDSNFGSALVTSNPLGPLEFSLGANLITHPLDPTGTAQLPSRITQFFEGVKITLFGALELNAEASDVQFSDPEVLPLIGATDETALTAFQASLSYFDQAYGYSISLGYQRLGDDFYNANLTNPGLATYITNGQDCFLFKTRFSISADQTMGVNLSSVYTQGINQANIVNANYNQRLFKLAYLNLAWRSNLAATPSQQSTHQASANLALSF
jgi:hypothetical protein